MSGKNKKHNSIIFLTTLSVYLSISLLGATPQVLAYAAMTRNFDIQTEIEYKDDLDNKPDNESASTPKLQSTEPDKNLLRRYSEEVKSFVETTFSTDFITDNSFSLKKEAVNFTFSPEKSAGNLFFNHSLDFENIPTVFFADNVLSASPIYTTNSKPEKTVYDGTRINSENNQVFIVTRLPRAAIDSSIR